MDEDDVAVIDDDVQDATVPDAAMVAAMPHLSKTRSLSDGGGSPAKLSPSPLLIKAAARSSRDDSSLTESLSTRSKSGIDDNWYQQQHHRYHHHHRHVFHDTPATISAAVAPTNVIPAPSTASPHRPSHQDIGVQSRLPGRRQHPLSLLLPHLPTAAAADSDSSSPRSHTTTPAPAATTPTSSSVSRPLSPKLDKLDPFDHSQLYLSPTGNLLPRRSRGLDFSRVATSLHHSTLAEHSSPDSSPTVAAFRSATLANPGRETESLGAGVGAANQSTTSLWSMMGSRERLHITTTNSPSSHQPMASVSDSSGSDDEDDLMDEDTDEPYVSTSHVSHTIAAMSPALSPAGCNLLSFQQRRRPRKPATKRLRGPIGLGFSTASAGATSLSRSPPNAYAQGTHGRRDSISLQAHKLHISGSESEESPRHGEGTDAATGTPVRDTQRSVIRKVVTRRGSLMPKTKNFARIRAALAEEGAPIESEFRREAEVVRQVRESDVGVDRHLQSLSTATTALSSPTLIQDAAGSVNDIPDLDMMATDSSMSLSTALKQRALKNPKAKNYWDTFSESSGSVAASRTTPPPPAFATRGSSEDVSMDSSSTPGNPQTARPVQALPTAAEITRRINGKRRRDDDFDPTSIKRRAVSPGISVHNSPIMQSPMQRDSWGSRPGSNGGDVQRSGSVGNGSAKGRVGLQGMVDTSDGMMRMSIE